MAITLGVNVIETDGKAAPSIQGAATSVGAATTGARSTLLTVIAETAAPLSAFEAVNVTLKGPAWSKPGVQLNVPTLSPGAGVNVAPAGRSVATSDVMPSPSGSAACTSNVTS